MIYESTLNAIAKAPKDRPVAVIMRHSVRYPILDEASVYTTILTPEGIRLAEEFGEKVAELRPIRKIVTNFVERCQQTADAIKSGAKHKKEVTQNLRLSHSFIEPVWDALPITWPDDVLPGRLLAVLDLAISDEHEPGVIDIFVTHDTIVGAVVGYLMGKKFNSTNWPDFLEGVLLWRDGSKLYAHWRGETREFSNLLS